MPIMNYHALFLVLTTLIFATTTQAAESSDSGRQVPSVDAAVDFLSADNFDSVMTRLSSRFTLGQISDFKISAETNLGYRRTSDNTVFPNDLYQIGMKVSAADRLNHFEAGLSSASDKPFDSADELNIHLSASREMKRWERSSLRVGLIYSNRLDYPLPMLLYMYSDADLSFMIGMPVASLRWKIDEKTTLAASYKPVRQARLAVEHNLYPTLKLQLEGTIEEDSYFIAGRSDKDRALVLEVPKVVFKANKKFSNQFDMGLSAGRSFGGRFFERKGFFDEYNKEKISDAWISGIDIKYTF